MSDGRLHEHKTGIKNIIGLHNFWTTGVVSCNNESKTVANIRNRYYQVLHLTQDTTWESDKNN